MKKIIFYFQDEEESKEYNDNVTDEEIQEDFDNWLSNKYNFGWTEPEQED